MDQSERAEWHYNQNVLLSRIAAEMGRLFIPGHNATQTPEYQAWVQEYRRLEVEKEWFDHSDNEPTHEVDSSG